MKAHLFFAVFAVLLIAGCDVSAPNSVLITTTPDTLWVCDPPTRVTVSWNAKNADATGVQVYVVGDKGIEVLFASSADLEGAEETGDWAVPSKTFVLKNQDGTKQLARFAIGSKPCE